MNFGSFSLTALAVLAASALGGGYSLVQIGRSLLAMRWPTVEGEIVDARVVHLADAGRGIDQMVRYRYHVAGQTYYSDRVSFGPQPTPTSFVPALDAHPNATAGLAERYPRGKPVRVYYNPRRPRVSVLYPVPNLRVWVIFAAALGFGVTALRGAF